MAHSSLVVLLLQALVVLVLVLLPSPPVARAFVPQHGRSDRLPYGRMAQSQLHVRHSRRRLTPRCAVQVRTHISWCVLRVYAIDPKRKLINATGEPRDERG